MRTRAFGTYDFHITDPKLFLKEVAGSDQHFRLDEFADTMRSRIVSLFTEALAQSHIPVLDVATRYSELGDALLPLINPVTTTKYGIEFTSFVVENISLPPEVEQAIDKRSSMAAVGNLNDYVKFQMAQGMAQPGGAGRRLRDRDGRGHGHGPADHAADAAATPGQSVPPPLPGQAAAARYASASRPRRPVRRNSFRPPMPRKSSA